MWSRYHRYVVNCLIAGVMVAALSLLAFGHRVSVHSGPVVFGPDGSRAVLCLASDDGSGAPHVTQKCDVCRIGQALDCADATTISMDIAWLPVAAPARPPVLVGRSVRVYDAVPRAPPA